MALHKWISITAMAAILTSSGQLAPHADPVRSRFYGDVHLTIGVHSNEPGIGLINSEGVWSGLDIAVAGYVMTWLHVPLSPTHFIAVDRVSNRGAFLLHGSVDLLIATYSITDDRERQGISFSAPYLVSYQGILTRSADRHAIRSVKDLRHLRVCTGPTDTTPYQHLMRVNQDDHLHVIISTENDSATCVGDLLGNLVDAVVGDDTILIGFQRQRTHMLTLARARFWPNPEQYGIGFIARSPADAAVLNAAIHQMIRDGSWKKAIVDSFCPGAADLASPCIDARPFLGSPPPAR